MICIYIYISDTNEQQTNIILSNWTQITSLYHISISICVPFTQHMEFKLSVPWSFPMSSNQSSPWALASAFTWLTSHFFGGMSECKVLSFWVSRQFISLIWLYNPQHTTNIYNMVSSIFQFTFESSFTPWKFNKKPKLLLWRCFSFRKVGIFRFPY